MDWGGGEEKQCFSWTSTSYKYILSETDSVELYERFNE